MQLLTIDINTETNANPPIGPQRPYHDNFAEISPVMKLNFDQLDAKNCNFYILQTGLVLVDV
jgi:hypothetical protein